MIGGNEFPLSRIPLKIGKRIYNEDVIHIILNLYVLLDNDAKKVSLWLCTKNPHLGGIRPYEMILFGRTEKLYAFINSRLEERGL